MHKTKREESWRRFIPLKSFEYLASDRKKRSNRSGGKTRSKLFERGKWKGRKTPPPPPPLFAFRFVRREFPRFNIEMIYIFAGGANGSPPKSCTVRTMAPSIFFFFMFLHNNNDSFAGWEVEALHSRITWKFGMIRQWWWRNRSVWSGKWRAGNIKGRKRKKSWTREWMVGGDRTCALYLRYFVLFFCSG